MPHTHDFEHILDDDGVIAVDYDETTDTVRVFVIEKLPESALADEDLISARIDHARTDVVEIGEPQFENGSLDATPFERREVPKAAADRHRRHRPIPPGVSEMHASGGAATGGPLARVLGRESSGSVRWSSKRDLAGSIVRVSNNHVYGLAGNAAIGDSIYQPSALDGGTDDDVVGAFVRYVPFDSDSPNTVDAAARSLAGGLDEELLRPHDLGAPYGESVRREDYRSLRGDTVTKSGRTTGVTRGTLQATGASVNVRYSQDRVIRFRDQLICTDMSNGGDSGSPVYLEGSGALVGLLFAGSDSATIANPIAAVEEQLGVKMLTEMPDGDGGGSGNGDGSGPGGGDSPGGGNGPPDGSPPGDEPGGGGGPPDEPPGEGNGPPDHANAPFVRDITLDKVREAIDQDLSELAFEDIVEAWAIEEFGADNIARQVRLPETGRYCDLFIRGPLLTLACELENDWEAVYKGVGQTQGYAAHNPRYQPCVILPEGLVEQPEADMLRQRCPIVEFPVPDSE